MKANRVVVIAAAFTVVATFYSLSELHTMSTSETGATGEVPFATGQGDWKDFTNLAAHHIETLPGKHTNIRSDAGSETRSTLETEKGRKQIRGAIQASPNAKVATPDSNSKSVTESHSSAKPAADKKCYFYEHTELWGDVVVWGSTLKVDTAQECCDKCRNHKVNGPDELDCNVWVFCGDKDKCRSQYQECWLKHLVHPEASKPARQGPEVPWTSGTIDVDINADVSKFAQEANVDPEKRKFHIVTSAQGSAVHWQCRVHYYWYKKRLEECNKQGKCEMGGWTRLLHSGKADDLMDELPTIVVDPLPQDTVEHSWYVVLNRPYAFVQWVQKAQIPEKYVLMAEPDHVFLRPLPNFMRGENPAAFPFFYIEPAKKDHQKITMKFTGPLTRKELEQIAPIGNSPTFLSLADMKTVMPIWMNTSIAIFKDQEANQVWGWVQEMYGFTIALFLANLRHVDLYLNLMAQPPWDTQYEMAPGKPYHILHYTYGMDYKLTGEFTPGKFGEWRFDKRTYSVKPPPRHLGEPPKAMKNDLVRALINSINEATDALPCWDKYAETGKVEHCDEKPKTL